MYYFIMYLVVSQLFQVQMTLIKSEPSRGHILILATFLLITNVSIFCNIFSPISSPTGYNSQFVQARVEQSLLSSQDISLNTIIINLLLVIGVYKQEENFVLVWLLLLPPFLLISATRVIINVSTFLSTFDVNLKEAPITAYVSYFANFYVHLGLGSLLLASGALFYTWSWIMVGGYYRTMSDHKLERCKTKEQVQIIQ